jgi:hypothetical protein
MAIPVKIECECGQRYAFDAEPVNGQMPSAIAGPSCGVDGTAAANEIISRQLATEPVAVAEPKSAPIRIAVPATIAPAPVRRTLLPGQMDRTQAEHEARAKAMWGDSQEEVTKYLMIQGLNVTEASSLVQSIFKERAAAVRANGIRKILTGAGMICVPIIALIVFLAIGVILIKVFAITIAIGLWGVWRTINGIMMAVAPKSEKGDVGEQ